MVEIVEKRPTLGTFATLLDVDDEPGISELETRLAEDAEAPQVGDEPADQDAEALAEQTARRLGAEIGVIKELMTRGEVETALELVNATYRQHPNDLQLRQLVSQAEAAFVTAARRDLLQLEKVPILTASAHSTPVELAAPDQAFLLSQIDGRSDIQSLLWIAPMREVDLLKALWDMHRSGLIELCEACDVGGTTRYEPV